MRIGVISDTHGYLDPRALTALHGVERILHAGDIGTATIIEVLERIAPVVAVQGNVDAGTPLGRRYPRTQRLTLEGVAIYMTHIGGRPAEMRYALPEPKPDVYICGHSHVALLAQEYGVLFLNPGAAGRPRFGGSVSVALLDVDAGQANARIIPLETV